MNSNSINLSFINYYYLRSSILKIITYLSYNSHIQSNEILYSITNIDSFFSSQKFSPTNIRHPKRRHFRQKSTSVSAPRRNKYQDNTCAQIYFLHPLYIPLLDRAEGRFVRRGRGGRAFVPTMYCFGTTNKQKTAILHQVDWHRVPGFTMRIFGRHGPTDAFSMLFQNARVRRPR